MQRIAYWIMPTISVGVAIFILLFLININKRENVSLKTPYLPPEQKMASESSKHEWLENFYQKDQSEYFYPVREIYIESDMPQMNLNEKSFTLIADIENEYQQFCLNQELKRSSLKHLLRDKGDKIELLIFSKERSSLDNFINILKEYQIESNIINGE